MLSNRLKDTGIQIRADVDTLEVTSADHTSLLAQIPQKQRLSTDVAAWDALAQMVSIGGLPQASWNHASSFGKGYTFISPSYAFIQRGYVRLIKYRVDTCDIGSAQLKFKVFRYNYSTATYDLVNDQAFELTITVGGGQMFTTILPTPVFVEPGDIPGMYVTRADGRAWSWDLSSPARTSINDTRYANSDVVESNEFSSISSSVVELECFGYAPFAAFTGDSIFEGHNTATNYHGTMHDAITSGTMTIPGGILSSEPGFMTALASDFAFNYQNLALGSQTYAWIASTGAPACFAAKAHTVIILCGVNDVSGGRVWADVEANLDTIKTSFDASESDRLMICEILPWTAGTDAQAATLRTFNANLATWCAANGATLIKTHDKMAKIRTTTRLLDDMATAYNHTDNVHLSEAGVAKLGEIIYQALIS